MDEYDTKYPDGGPNTVDLMKYEGSSVWIVAVTSLLFINGFGSFQRKKILLFKN